MSAYHFSVGGGKSCATVETVGAIEKNGRFYRRRKRRSSGEGRKECCGINTATTRVEGASMMGRLACILLENRI
jgi:hypothetical protein